MSKKIASIALICLISAFAFVIPASAVTVGNIEVTKKIQSIACSYSDANKGSITLTATDGTGQTATYDSNGNITNAWCTTQVKSIAQNLLTAKLIDAFDETKILQDRNHKTVELSGLSTSGSGTATPGDTSGSADGPTTDESADAVEERCTSILPAEWCKDDGDGIAGILNLVLNIMTMGMGVLATIGLVISGIQWLTARDKEDQIVKAKSRIFNIVIGIMVWGIMWLVLQWLLPGGINLEIGT